MNINSAKRKFLLGVTILIIAYIPRFILGPLAGKGLITWLVIGLILIGIGFILIAGLQKASEIERDNW